MHARVERKIDEQGRVVQRSVARNKVASHNAPGSTHVLRSNLHVSDNNGGSVNTAQTETIFRQR